MDKDGDGAMDFEEFMTLCQLIYKDRGGTVVANRARQISASIGQRNVILTENFCQICESTGRGESCQIGASI